MEGTLILLLTVPTKFSDFFCMAHCICQVILRSFWTTCFVCNCFHFIACICMGLLHAVTADAHRTNDIIAFACDKSRLLIEKKSLSSSIASVNSPVFKVSNNPFPYSNSNSIKIILDIYNYISFFLLAHCAHACHWSSPIIVLDHVLCVWYI